MGYCARAYDKDHRTMSFFAGFVDGVFKGKDWRDSKEDRKRQQKIEDEDRDWTREARGRQRTVWTQADEDRARGQRIQDESIAQGNDDRSRRISEEDRAKANRDRLEAARRAALGEGEGISIMDAVPENTATSPAAERPAPAPSSRGLTVGAALGQLGASTQGPSVGRDVFADRLAAATERQAAPQPRAAQEARPPADPRAVTTVDEPVSRTNDRAQAPSSASRMPAAPQAPRTFIDTTPPTVVQTPTGPVRSDVLPPPDAAANPTRQIAPETQMYDRQAASQPRGFSIMDAIVSPAQASTLADETGMTQGQPYTKAELPPRQPQNMPVPDDHPFKAAIEQDRARAAAGGGLSSAADTTNPQIGRRIALGVQGIGDALTAPQVDPASPEFQEFQRLNPEGAAEALRQSQAADQRRQQRDAEVQGIRAAQPQGFTPATPAPATTPATTPAKAPGAQGQAPTTAQRQKTDQTQFFLGDTPISVTNAKPLQTGTVADVMAQLTGQGDQGSFAAVGESMTKRAGISVAAAMRGDGAAPKASVQEARAVSRDAGIRFRKENVDAYAKELEAQGMFAEAKAWREYAESENTRKGMEKLAEAMYFWNMNDEGRALQSILDLYNMKGYYEDGLTALSEGTSFQYDEEGRIKSLTATFRDDATGRVFQQTISGPRNKIMALIIGGLSPEATFAAAMESIGGSIAPKQAPQMTPELMLKIEAEAREQAKAAGGIEGPTEAAIAAARERIMRDMGFAPQQVPVWTGD
jgi:hypothetical protein